MTRKDYVLLAKALRDAEPVRATIGSPERVAWFAACASVSDALMRENPRFNSARFMDACTEPNDDWMHGAERAR